MVKLSEYKYYYKVDGYDYAETLLEGFFFDVYVTLKEGEPIPTKWEIEVTSKTKIPGIDMAYWYQRVLEGEDKKIKDILKTSKYPLVEYLEEAGDMTDGSYGLEW